MANRDMLAEAIADAKALKETAIANAKAALEEAFEPRLKSMLSAKLAEMEEMDEELDEVVNEASSEEVDEAKRAEDKETKRTEKMKYGKDLAEAEEDLDEILAELDELDEEKEDMNEEEEVEVDVDAEEEMEGEDEDEDIDLEEMSEDDLKSFIEDVIRDMVGAGELEAGEEFEVEDDMEDMEGEDEEELEVEDETEEIMENEKEEMEEGMMDKLKGIYNDPEVLGKLITVDGKKMSLKDFLAMAASGAKSGMAKSGAGEGPFQTEAKEEMDEMKKELDELRSELHEVNLLNAKLLYTNKIFRAKNLSENHKVKVLEAFDKAETVKEVKLVFETLNGELKEKTTIKENLGSASKPAGVAAKQPIVEVDSQVARWQKLAGIK